MGYVAIFVGAILVMGLGFVWFHPKVLGGTWMKGAGLTEDDMKEVNPLAMGGGFLMALVIAYATFQIC